MSRRRRGAAAPDAASRSRRRSTGARPFQRGTGHTQRPGSGPTNGAGERSRSTARAAAPRPHVRRDPAADDPGPRAHVTPPACCRRRAMIRNSADQARTDQQRRAEPGEQSLAGFVRDLADRVRRARDEVGALARRVPRAFSGRCVTLSLTESTTRSHLLGASSPIAIWIGDLERQRARTRCSSGRRPSACPASASLSTSAIAAFHFATASRSPSRAWPSRAARSSTSRAGARPRSSSAGSSCRRRPCRAGGGHACRSRACRAGTCAARSTGRRTS